MKWANPHAPRLSPRGRHHNPIVRGVLASWIAITSAASPLLAQAPHSPEVVTLFRRTLDAVNAPAADPAAPVPALEISRIHALRALAVAGLARAGEPDEALKIALADGPERLGTGWTDVMVEVARAQAARAQAAMGAMDQAGHTLEAAFHTARESFETLVRVQGPTTIARAAAELGQYEIALRLATEISHERNRNFVLGRVGNSLVRAGRVAEAIRVAERVADGQSAAELWSAIAAEQARQGDRRGSERSFARVEALARSNPEWSTPTVSIAVRWLAEAGDVDRALDATTRIRDADKRDASRQEISVIQVRRGDRNAALRTARSIAGPYWRALAISNLAEVIGATGDVRGAQRLLREALALAAHFKRRESDPIRSMVASAQVRLQLADDAVRTIAGYRNGTERIFAFVELGRRLDDAGHSGRARSCLNEAERMAVRISTKSDRERFLVAGTRARSQLGDARGAKAVFAAYGAAASTFNRATALLAIAHAEIVAGDRAAASRSLDAVRGELALIGEGSVDDVGKPSMLGEVALAYLNAGDIGKARAVLRADLPEPSYAHAAIGRAEAKAGRLAETVLWADTVDDNLSRASVLAGAAQGLLELRLAQQRQ